MWDKIIEILLYEYNLLLLILFKRYLLIFIIIDLNNIKRLVIFDIFNISNKYYDGKYVFVCGGGILN